MRYPRSVKIFRGQIDAAPFVGVMFLMTIFLVLHSHLVNPTGLEISLPESGEPLGVTGPSVILGVDRSGTMFFENRLLDAEALKVRLTEIVEQGGEPPSLLVQADKGLTLAQLQEIFELARSCGIRNAALANKRSVVSDVSETE